MKEHPERLGKDLLEDLKGESSDVVREVKTRLEQSKLREILLDGKNSNDCKLCGNTFSKEFLVAAHIKPRRICEEEERLDPNVAMLLCKFGCDELFERGYLVVDDHGRILENKKSDDIVPMSYAKMLKGKACRGWSSGKSSKYFVVHREHHEQARSRA